MSRSKPESIRHRVHSYRTTPDLIADELRDEIRRGVLVGGQPLPQEELAIRFGVSRIPVREALLRLEGEGLVAVYPNRGAVVTRLSVEDVREIYHLRRLLEGDLLARAARRMDDADLKRVEAAMDRAERGAGDPDWAVLDGAFHEALYAPAGHARQLSMITALRGTVDRYWGAYRALPDHTGEWLADHRRIVEACRLRDAELARQVLHEHLARAAIVVLDGLKAEQAAGGN
ncbi:MAG TPA: GntR family transcriptional regulator [Aliidongia sp.]|uniref:GntR family transcriptional regulator n=1 Tax=Aliidongia sp. TaxID=1914230 RepID=UPI002DDD0B93|nr:GntR family transcriptional regulator [Aliidongia sp.]HEV2673535.1 GntR family transcriptional regulator [Aliidongia sp.]